MEKYVLCHKYGRGKIYEIRYKPFDALKGPLICPVCGDKIRGSKEHTVSTDPIYLMEVRANKKER